ncbi:MAG: hypothetical protein JW718_08630 [Desulfovibrionaceae bacterium]|nr:hypothetical protein [Desulfovibrionaceae bacterium]
MNYVQHLNACFRSAAAARKPFVAYGQNIAAGSCVSGLTRGVAAGLDQVALNTPNAENTLVGVGFGLMLGGVSSAYFLKQQDFLLLGLDQIVNTYNYVRQSRPTASYSIVTVVVDSGYEGIQSSLNNFHDFCSFARVQGYCLTNRQDSELLIPRLFKEPGFRIIGVSQRLFRTEVLDFEAGAEACLGGEFFRYRAGDRATVACCNFSLPQGLALCRGLEAEGLSASLFSVNAVLPSTWDPVLDDARRTGGLVVLDDSKSANRSGHRLALAAHQSGAVKKVLVRERSFTDQDLRPAPEVFEVEVGDVLRVLS